MWPNKNPPLYCVVQNHSLYSGQLFYKVDEQRPVLISAHPLAKIRRKLPRKEIEITQLPNQVHRSPRCHMKDKWDMFVVYCI